MMSQHLRACPLAPNEVIVVDDVISAAEQDTLLRWAEAQYRKGYMFENPADPGAWCSSFQSIHGGLTSIIRGDPGAQRVIWLPEVRETDRFPDEFWDIRRRVAELLQLEDYDEDPYKGSFLSYIGPGTGVHTHVDARLDVGGDQHMLLRCNVLLRRPLEGGLPVIESLEIDVADRGMWAFFPSELVHSATRVRGAEHRGLLSFGFVVHPLDIWERRYRLTRQFATEYALDGSPKAVRKLLDALAVAPGAAAIDHVRRQMFGLVLSGKEVSVSEAASEVGEPPDALWFVFRDMQRSAIIEPSAPIDGRCRRIDL